MKTRVHMQGFTLIELLVVIGIIALLAAILLPAMNAAFRKAEVSQAQAEVKGIETALRSFYTDYSRFPVDAGSGDASGEVAGTLLAALRGLDNNLNPKKNLYLEVKTESLLNGRFTDPWSSDAQPRVYQYAVDRDFNNEIVVPSHGTLQGRTVAVWSYGPDGQAGTGDDVTSWK